MRKESPAFGACDLQAKHWQRRDFMRGVAALAGAAGLSAYDMRFAAAEPPPETTKVRIHVAPVTCIAPEIVAQELLYAEGFTEVQFVNFPKETQLWPPESFLAGETDIGFSFSPTDIRFIDAGAACGHFGSSAQWLRRAGRKERHPLHARPQGEDR